MPTSSTRARYTAPPASEITPQQMYQERRRFLLQTAAVAASGAVAMQPRWGHAQTAAAGKLPKLNHIPSALAGARTLEALTPYNDVTQYNNYYEFGLDKGDPARNAHSLKTDPWQVQVDGLVAKPQSFGIEDLLSLSAQEERIYRMRCVEGWSMVIPWIGYSLAELLRKVEPLGSAKYVQFFTQADPAWWQGRLV